jgi:hypothetical protein
MLFFIIPKNQKKHQRTVKTKAGLSPYRQYSTVAMILEFDSCHLDFNDEMSNYKTDQPLVRCMINSWSFFRAKVGSVTHELQRLIHFFSVGFNFFFFFWIQQYFL